jgi:thymidylate kinase
MDIDQLNNKVKSGTLTITVSIEGAAGSGKTLAASLIKELLKQNGLESICFQERGNVAEKLVLIGN